MSRTLKTARAYFDAFTGPAAPEVYHGFTYFAPGLHTPSGWVRELENPARFRPGVLFFDLVSGAQYIALGGSYESGAARFFLLPDDKKGAA